MLPFKSEKILKRMSILFPIFGKALSHSNKQHPSEVLALSHIPFNSTSTGYLKL